MAEPFVVDKVALVPVNARMVSLWRHDCQALFFFPSERVPCSPCSSSPACFFESPLGDLGLELLMDVRRPQGGKLSALVGWPSFGSLAPQGRPVSLATELELRS